MSNADDFLFDSDDIRSDVLQIVLAAASASVLSIEDVFLFGMSQGHNKDWEDYGTLVHEIERQAEFVYPPLSASRMPKELLAAFEAYHRNQHEAAQDAAADAASGV